MDFLHQIRTVPNTHRCRGESQFIELYVFTFSLLLQVIYFLLDVRIWAADTGVMVTLTDVPLEVWLIALLWPGHPGTWRSGEAD